MNYIFLANGTLEKMSLQVLVENLMKSTAIPEVSLHYYLAIFQMLLFHNSEHSKIGS